MTFNASVAGQVWTAAEVNNLKAQAVHICTSTSRPTSTSIVAVGTRIHETDTGREYICTQATPSIVWQRLATSATQAGRLALRVRRAANQSILNATPTYISWDTEDQDTENAWAPTSNVFTVPTGLGGLYVCAATLTGPGGWQGNANYTASLVAGGTAYPLPQAFGAANQGQSPMCGFPVVLAAADTVQVQVNQVTGSAQNFQGSLAVHRIGM